MRATILYTVHADISPDIEDDYLAWLENGHIETVLSADGFLWAKKIVLDDRAPDGWLRIMVQYGVRNRADLTRYQSSDLFRGFARELEPFEGQYRVSRSVGEIDFEVDA